jgi:predicted ATPase
VDIPVPKDRTTKLAPEELRRRQLAALIAWFLAGARSQPAALAFEDLHWADPTSLDLMQALAERGRTAPLFIIATARPEFRPPWSLRSHHSVISLSPLNRADVAQMVGELAARHALSKEVVAGVSERTGGVPLYVEEVARLLLERGETGGLQAIPPTLQQSLAARLDRLGEAREVAQIGAVLGRDFTYSLLRAVGGVQDPSLQLALDRLADADLLIAEGAGSEATYRFKHALIQDAAYDSLLKSRRQALHRRAAPPNSCAISPSALRPSRKSSPIISPRPASTSSQSNGGAKRAIKPCAVRRSRRRSPISARRSRWRTWRGAAARGRLLESPPPRANALSCRQTMAER